MKREADFTLLFRHWLRANPKELPVSSAFELKQTRDDSIPYSDVKEHQLDALIAVTSREGLLYKIPDDSRGVKPFDLFYMHSNYAFVVIRFPKCFCIIQVEVFVWLKDHATRKSLTCEEAKKAAIITVDL